MKLTRGKVVGVLAVLVILAAAFWYGGGAPGLQGWTVEKTTPPPVSLETAGSTPQTTPLPSASLVPAASALPAPTENPAAQEETEPAATPAPTSGIESRPGGLEGGFTAEEKIAAAQAIAGGSSPGVEKGDAAYSEAHGMVLDPNTGKDKYLTDPVPEGKPAPVEPEDSPVDESNKLTCTISIRCDTILNNMDLFDQDKLGILPRDGVI